MLTYLFSLCQSVKHAHIFIPHEIREQNRNDKTLMLADLREQDTKEQDADIVIFIYRNMYDLDDNHQMHPLMETELIVSQNRSGQTGTAKCICETRLVHFAHLQHEG